MKNYSELLTWLFNPFKYIAGIKALIVGFSAMIIIGVLSYYFHIRIDGLHHLTLLTTKNLMINILDVVLHWIILSTVFTILLLLFQSKFRGIDVFGTLSITFIPIIFSVLILEFFSKNILFMAFLGILFLAWQIVLIYNAIKTSAGINGIKLNSIVTIGFIFATLISYKAFPIYFTKQNKFYQFPKTTEISQLDIAEDSIEALSIKLLNALQMHDYKFLRQHFNPKMERIMTEDRLDIVWRAMVRKHGRFIEILNIKTDITEDSKMVYLNCQFANRQMTIQFNFNSTEQLSGIYFKQN